MLGGANSKDWVKKKCIAIKRSPSIRRILICFALTTRDDWFVLTSSFTSNTVGRQVSLSIRSLASSSLAHRAVNSVRLSPII